ncbi:MAG: ribonuclease E inhibitor RraB [Clostridiaceae bacterium]|nr:ribonuclease E inhibitor RraB [Clostridiaceae bacterium]
MYPDEYSIIFNLLFENSDNAIKCRDAAQRNGFEKAIYFDNSKNAKEIECLKKYYHIVGLQITSKIGLERININCKKVMDFATQYSGELQEWMFGELLD